MKKRIALLILASSVCLLSAAGCGGKKTESGDQTAAAKQETAQEAADDGSAGTGETGELSAENGQLAHKVSVFLPAGPADPRWSEDAEILTLQLEQAGIDAEVLYADEDADLQARQISEQLDTPTEALVIAPVDPYALTEVLQGAGDASIPVFSYDRLVMDTDSVTYFINYNLREIGQKVAENLVSVEQLQEAQENHENRTIEFLLGSPDEIEELFFFNGVMEVLQPYLDDGTLSILSGRDTFEETAVMNGDPAEAGRTLAQILEDSYKGTNLQILCTSGDAIAAEARKVLSDASIRSCYVTGIGCQADMIKSMAAGNDGVSVFMDNRTLAETCASAVSSYLSGEKPEVSDYAQYDNGTKIIRTITCEAGLIDKDNYQMLIDNGYYTEEEIALDLLVTATPMPTPVVELATPSPEPSEEPEPVPDTTGDRAPASAEDEGAESPDTEDEPAVTDLFETASVFGGKNGEEA